MNPEPIERPKVCHIIHEGQSRGGGGTVTLSYFPAYLSSFDTFAIVGQEGDLAPQLRERGVRTLVLPMERPWKGFLSLPALWNILRREKPAAVIVHGQWGGMFGACAARAAGIRVVIYYAHFPSFYTDWDMLRTIRNRLAESVTCRCATKIVCLGQGNRYQYLLRHLALPEEKVICIPNCVLPPVIPTASDREQLRRELDLPDESDGPLVMSMGRLVDQKRIDWVLRAWALVEARGTPARLIIVGGGPEEKPLRRLAQDLGLKRYSFLGARSQACRYYPFARLGISCSMFEALSLALIEAMFCGCPMIGTNVDGVSEAIVDSVTGLIVPPADPPALAGAILALLADPGRASRMGEAARLRAHDLYHADKVLPRQLQLVKDELKNQARFAF